MGYAQKKKPQHGEDFLWLVSLSDLMILLFIFFVVMFSVSYKKMKQAEFQRVMAHLRNQKPPANPIDDINKKLADWVSTQKLPDQISITKTDDAVIVEIGDKVLFSSGEFHPHAEGVRLMKLLRDTLEKVPKPYKIGIEGHTDDSPIHTSQIEDNWDLSAKRALSVLYSLNLSSEVLKRTVVMAYGDTRPIVPNRDAEGYPIAMNQARNRRVTLRIF